MLANNKGPFKLLAVLHPLEAGWPSDSPSDNAPLSTSPTPVAFQAKGHGNTVMPVREPEPKLLNSVQLDWESGYRSQLGEYSCELDEIDGALPETLLGTLFRNGPGLFGEPPLLSADVQLINLSATNHQIMPFDVNGPPQSEGATAMRTLWMATAMW